MIAYHGTAARFPPKRLTGGPDTAAFMGTPMPGLWLTETANLAAHYASWSADCTRSKLLRIITLEMTDDCPRIHNPERPADFLIQNPEHEYKSGNLRILRAYRVYRKRLHTPPISSWHLTVPPLDVNIIALHAKDMAKLSDLLGRPGNANQPHWN